MTSKKSIDFIACAAVVLLALGVRLLYLFEIEANPLFYHPAGDGRVYDEWAQRIASGDLLGQGVFYQAPLYPYFLGLLQFILGHDLWSIRLVQITLGAVSCGLVFLAGRAFFGRAAGVAAGIIVSLYAPAIFYDALIQKAVLDLVLVALIVLLLASIQARPQIGKWVVSGALLGFLALSRDNVLVWIFAVPVWIWFYFSPERSTVRLRWVMFFLAGSMLVLVPVGLRNLKAGGEFALTTSQIGANFYIGNNAGADGTYVPLRGGHGDARFERQDATELAEQALGRSLSPKEVSRYWLGRSLDYIVSEPIDWLGLMGKKWLLVWNVFEVEDADDFYLYQTWSRLLSILGKAMHFGLLAPLAAIGCVLTWKRWRRLCLLYVLLGSFAASVALIYVFGRYRVPLVPILALFAGAAVVEAFALYREKRLREGIMGALVGLAALVIVHWPILGKPGPSAAAYSNLGNALVKQGRTAEAQQSYERALQIEPTDAAAHYNLANLRASQGDSDRAAHHYRQAIRSSPDFAEAYNNFGNVLLSRDELGDAAVQFRKALEISPNRSEFHFGLATALARKGDLAEAMAHLQRALEVQPDFPEAHLRLGLVMAAQGQLDKAVDQFRSALRIRPEFAEAHESLGRALAELGRRDEAIGHYQEALRILKSQRESSRPR
ncbi:MAG: tetratricopeptide repeat protein [Deltaproteobacteria bacterium]|nr:tetratricopeptide repeat protein [Deltaproteobacteria bacterium]